MKKLANKTAVIYGNGSTGAGIAKAFSAEGANIFLAGRTQSRLDAIAQEIRAAGGTVETAQVDALDEKAVQTHLQKVSATAGKIDIVYNAVGISQKKVQGTMLAELSVENFCMPLEVYLKANFITAKAALKYMTAQGNGVIIMHTPNASRISEPFIGGMPSTWAAIEALSRSISVEYGKSGVRSVCLHTTAIPETPLIDEVFDIHGRAHDVTFDQFQSTMEERTHRRRLTTLRELTAAAVFVASDDSSALTGTILNLTAGMIVE